MQVKFYLRSSIANKNGLCPVECSITFNAKRLKYNIKVVRATVKNWKPREQRVKPNHKNEPYNYYIEYNKLLDEEETKIKKIFRHLLLNNIDPTIDSFKKLLKENTNSISNNDFFQSFDDYINTIKPKFSNNTIKTYNTTKNWLLKFEKHLGSKISFETIDSKFYDELITYAFEHKKISNNYTSKIITQLKTFMSWALDRGYHENLGFQKFKTFEHEIEVIYLTKDELFKLYNFKFNNIRLEHVKDTYCFGCFTGLRYSDLKQLRASHIFEDSIKKSILKTSTIDHEIPLNKYSKEILEKYKQTIYEPIPIISGQKFNVYIKECCKIVGINTLTTITKFSGNKRTSQTVPKYELITSHTARKTFVTNSLIFGMKELVLRNITNHKKDDSFKRYVKIAEDFKQQEMQNTWDKV